MSEPKINPPAPPSPSEETVQPASPKPEPTRAMRRVQELQIKGPRLNGRPVAPYRRPGESK
jgi:hypothetical protein